MAPWCAAGVVCRWCCVANKKPLEQDTDAFTPRPDERALQAQIQELVCYVWDNYLQMYRGVEDLFLMGVGNAYLGIKVLLINRGMFARVQPLLRQDRSRINRI
jgi:hypothetical protein